MQSPAQKAIVIGMDGAAMELGATHGGSRSHAPFRSTHGAGRQAAHDRRLSNPDPTRLDGHFDRSLGGNPSGHGLQYPQVRRASRRDRVGHQHRAITGRVLVEHGRAGWQKADLGQVGDVVASDRANRHPSRGHRPRRVQRASDHRLPSLCRRRLGHLGQSADRATPRRWTRVRCKRCATSIR